MFSVERNIQCTYFVRWTFLSTEKSLMILIVWKLLSKTIINPNLRTFTKVWFISYQNVGMKYTENSANATFESDTEESEEEYSVELSVFDIPRTSKPHRRQANLSESVLLALKKKNPD